VRVEPFLGRWSDRRSGSPPGTLDQPTGLRTTGHVYVSQAADYEVLVDDGLPHLAAGATSDAARPPG